MYNGESHTFLATDKQEQVNGESSTGTTYTSETLNQQNPSGLPAFKLDLKVGYPIMLLRNLAPISGLCNGTRLRVEICEQHVIMATILTGDKAGEVVFIPRISLTPSSSHVLIRMTRRQFSIRLAYAMTINKSQGQSLKYVGVDLRSPVFSHGELCVALSRCISAGRIHVLLPKHNTRHETTNVVYPEVLS
ncbi:ATP-dependent DNA helicase PIF1-like [Papaver somniferum]|uniref:ATP-dependent DNA helicase PIF1-like n=1 Tax=Papaver somniferum TaxID=3469 RepID=UPI000E702FDB|nr:ATP-dependent DNA helicase PIF1-like [Papaver somniferum]